MKRDEFILIPSYLAPGLNYFRLINKYNRVVVFDEELYRKQSPRNHFEILTSQGPLTITYPVKKPWRDRMINAVELDLNQKWIRNHWKSINTAYGKAPFFEFYESYFRTVLENPPESLFKLNMKMLELCLKLLKIRNNVVLYSGLEQHHKDSPLMLQYLAEFKTNDENFGQADDEMSYPQLFGNDFVQGMSIMDLLFNHGPESGLYLR